MECAGTTPEVGILKLIDHQLRVLVLLFIWLKVVGDCWPRVTCIGI